MFKNLVNKGINYLSTGAGFLPSTVLSSYSQAVVQVVFFVSGGRFYLFIVVIWSGLKKIRIANRWCVVRWTNCKEKTNKFFGSKPRDSLDTAITTNRFAPWK